ncbi:nuclear RNA export factor 1 [Anopheles bellator]|uniref:nuclear RNA export factor 1 n=1 Tax=Anopheles bellator TaxID=139047 RepID=UPI00264A1BE8|nr:nuclear RNA export factor 1 [Anopheles bellator]
MPRNFRHGNNRGRGGRQQGGERGFYDASQKYSEHDNRADRTEWNDRDRNDRNVTNVKRRVSFKPFNFKQFGKNGRALEQQIRMHVSQDDDEAMRGDTFDGESPVSYTANRNKFNRQRRSGSPIPRGVPNANIRKKITPSNTNWFEVKVPYGNKYPKEVILRLIQHAISPQFFIPLYYKTAESAVTFYVEEFHAAEAIQKVNRKIDLPDGRKMILLVRNNHPPSQVNDQLKDRMRQAMVKRYNSATKALNLEKFHADPDLSDIFCGLFRPQIILVAVDIIAEHIPELEALNLNDNKLYMLDHLKSMATKIPNLKILYLSKNRIPYVNTLDSLKSLKLVELNLEDNPLKQRFEDQTVYVSEVRKRFPKVIKLDSMDLPPPISFDVDDDVKVPSAKASFLCDAAGADLVRQFLEQYFAIFDSDNRQPLLEAYHEHAIFSLTVNTYQQNNQQRLGAYMSGNRNIKHKTDLDSRCRLLKQGRLPVVSYLSELPATKHDPQSFAVDLTLLTPQLLLLTVTGVFKERKQNSGNEPIRSFQRSLVIVPCGSGFCIRNEMVHITNSTRLQDEKAFKDQAGFGAASIANRTLTSNASNVPVMQQSPISAPVVAPDDNTKLQMVQALATQSAMNLEWSRRCLEETNWDYQRAEFAFNELHKQNRIPPEAFIKN